MKQRPFIWVLALPLVLTLASCKGRQATAEAEQRDPLKQPFASTSIWNMSIGSEARYVHAYIEPAMKMTVDENIIVMTPEAPLMDIYEGKGQWDVKHPDWRCYRTEREKLLFRAPIPQNFIVSPDTWDGLTPNSTLAVLMPDGHTIKQTQPFAHCKAGEWATSVFMFDDVDLYGDGTYGAHGGSGLSGIGGTLRVGELTPTSGPIRHVMKVELFSQENLYYDGETCGFRWPARTADSGAKEYYYMKRTNPVVKECRMGALLALPASMDLDSLKFETKPARILAQAFQDYGAYVVDDTAWDVYAIATEWGPNGRFMDEFEKNWGFPFHGELDSPWGRDLSKIFLNLHVVDNNAPDRIGGGGKPRQPLAPEIKPQDKK